VPMTNDRRREWCVGRGTVRPGRGADKGPAGLFMYTQRNLQCAKRLRCLYLPSASLVARTAYKSPCANRLVPLCESALHHRMTTARQRCSQQTTERCRNQIPTATSACALSSNLFHPHNFPERNAAAWSFRRCHNGCGAPPAWERLARHKSAHHNTDTRPGVVQNPAGSGEAQR
jgi:hypothetical protein